jgi:hypothetical protein
MISRQKSTRRILDFLETNMPTLPDAPAAKRDAKASVEEDTVPTPESDKKFVQGSNPKRKRQIAESDGIDPVVEATDMAMAPTATSNLIDRLLTGSAKNRRLP